MSRNRMKVLLPVAVVMVAAIITVILVQAKPAVEKEEKARATHLVRAMEVSSEDVRLDVESQGAIEARRQTEMVAEVSGRVVSVHPEFAAGGFFRSGETLVQLDPRDYEVAVAQAESALAQARTRLAREQAEAEVAREEWNELGSGEPSPLVLRQPQVNEANAAVEAAEASRMRARLNLARTSIEAPFAGRVLSKRADLGQFVAAGAPIATIYATDFAEVSLPVTAEDLAFIELDAIGTANAPRVTLIADYAGAPRRWEGVLVRTGGAIDPSSRMLNLIARVDQPFRQTGGNFTPLQVGLFVQAQIEGKIAEDVFVVPRAALRRDGRVLVADRESRIHFRNVDVVRTTEDRAVIRSGLEEGELLVLSALETPVEGMKVEIAESGAVDASSTELATETRR